VTTQPPATTAARLRFCFNLDRARLGQCFAPETVAAIGDLVDLDPEVADGPGGVTDEWLRPRLAAADGCITGWGSLPLDAARLAGAPRLRYVLHSAGSVKSLVSDALWERGIRLTSAANVNGRPVAEFALGLLLCCLKDVFRFQVEFKQRGSAAWRRAMTIPGYYRTTVGVVGAGNVGRQLMRLLQPHDFRVLVYDPWLEPAEAAALGAQPTGLEELLRSASAVVLLAPNIPENRHMIGAGELALLPDGAYFINPGRGALVDHEALIAELRTGRITACLDVADPEPPPEGSPLYTLPNCILTPHVAGSLNAECLRLGEQVLTELRHLLAGEPLENEVTRQLLPRLG
jgi:phosphoglycerate dehydrogenase-like enzyme